MLLNRIISDDEGVVVSVELVLVAVVALIGLMVGMMSVRDACISELSDVAGSLQDINQSFNLNGVIGHSAVIAGSDFIDANDFCDDNDDAAGQADNCIAVSATAAVGAEDAVTAYTNSDNTTDIGASQNSTNMKWQWEPGQEEDADEVTQAILSCIAAGEVAEIEWTNSSGETFTFLADAVTGDSPNFLFSGSGSESGSGKVSSVTVSCPIPNQEGGG